MQVKSLVCPARARVPWDSMLERGAISASCFRRHIFHRSQRLLSVLIPNLGQETRSRQLIRLKIFFIHQGADVCDEVGDEVSRNAGSGIP
jgi:hypothetical protein